MASLLSKHKALFPSFRGKRRNEMVRVHFTMLRALIHSTLLYSTLLCLTLLNSAQLYPNPL